jgi:hypothetical protein
VITFSQLGHYGRLGNQLFQFAMLKSVALERGYQLKIPNPDNIIFQNQNCYLNKFNISCDYLTEEDLNNIRYRFIEPNHSSFYPEVFSAKDGTDFHGFFQNYIYFAKHIDVIRNEFKLKEDIRDKAAEYLNTIKDSDAEIVSIHVRRGDNLDGTNPEYANFYGLNDILTENSHYGRYIYPALDIFKNKNVKYLIFSGGSRKGDKHNQSDIEWCKLNFKQDNVIFCEGNTDIVDFEIMRQCDHNITCHMSSFGWWAALLNDNPDKIVVAPKSYTVPSDGREKWGFYPKSWKRI